jgi:hypothetical protein
MPPAADLGCTFLRFQIEINNVAHVFLGNRRLGGKGNRFSPFRFGLLF